MAQEFHRLEGATRELLSFHDGDFHAYRGGDGYHVLVDARKVEQGIQSSYVETSAQALLARVLWLGSKGCDYPWDALRYLKEDVIAEVEEQEKRTRNFQADQQR